MVLRKDRQSYIVHKAIGTCLGVAIELTSESPLYQRLVNDLRAEDSHLMLKDVHGEILNSWPDLIGTAVGGKLPSLRCNRVEDAPCNALLSVQRRLAEGKFAPLEKALGKSANARRKQLGLYLARLMFIPRLSTSPKFCFRLSAQVAHIIGV